MAGKDLSGRVAELAIERVAGLLADRVVEALMRPASISSSPRPCSGLSRSRSRLAPDGE